MPHIERKRRLAWQPEPKAPQEGRKFINKRYHTQRHRKMRAAHLAKHPLCVECLKNGKDKAARILDHIVPVSTGKTEAEQDALHWDLNNHQGLCVRCHNIKSAKEKNI